MTKLITFKYDEDISAIYSIEYSKEKLKMKSPYMLDLAINPSNNLKETSSLEKKLQKHE